MLIYFLSDFEDPYGKTRVLDVTCPVIDTLVQLWLVAHNLDCQGSWEIIYFKVQVILELLRNLFIGHLAQIQDVVQVRLLTLLFVENPLLKLLFTK